MGGLDERIKAAQTNAVKRTSKRPEVPCQVAPPLEMVMQAVGQGGVAQGGGTLVPEMLLGTWADSLGNAVSVCSIDAFQVRLMATLSQPPRPDIHLKILPAATGGWICGNAMLDPLWSTETQLHWLTVD